MPEPEATPAGNEATGGVPPTEPSAIETGGAPAPGSAIETGGDPPDLNAALEVPEKFRNDDGTLNEQNMFKSYGELEKKLGTIGAPPETVDGYKLELEGKFPEGVELNEEGHKEFLGRCHERGMTNDMVQFIMDEYAGVVGEAVTASSNTREGTIESLKGVWGDKYHDNMTAALNALNAAGVEGIDRARIGNDPDMIQVLSVLGANLTEDQITPGAPSTGGMSPEELESLMKSDAYLKAKHPDHAKVMAQVQRVFEARAAHKKGKRR